jgi:hypothetical protein
MPVRHLPPGSPGILLRPSNAPVFSGAPLNPEPTSQRGLRKKNQKELYGQNLAQRQAQSCPASPAKPRFVGPHHRAPGISGEQWERVMTGKVSTDTVENPRFVR